MKSDAQRTPADLAAAEPRPPTAFVIDRHDLSRRGNAYVLGLGGIPTEQCANLRDFFKVYSPDRTGCIVLEPVVSVALMDFSGTALFDELLARQVTLPVIIVSCNDNVHHGVHYGRSGILDFIYKPADPDLLIMRVRAAIAVDAKRRAATAESVRIRGLLATLTPREDQTFRLVMAGLTNREIADQLQISVKTVENHRAKIMAKTGAENVVELTRIAMGVPISADHFPAERAATGTHLGRLPEAIGGAT